MRNALVIFVVSVLTLVGCTTSQMVSASGDRQKATARAIVGTSLIGARGATPKDQDKIDDTVAGVCGAGVWTKSECARH